MKDDGTLYQEHYHCQFHLKNNLSLHVCDIPIEIIRFYCLLDTQSPFGRMTAKKPNFQSEAQFWFLITSWGVTCVCVWLKSYDKVSSTLPTKAFYTFRCVVSLQWYDDLTGILSTTVALRDGGLIANCSLINDQTINQHCCSLSGFTISYSFSIFAIIKQPLLYIQPSKTVQHPPHSPNCVYQ